MAKRIKSGCRKKRDRIDLFGRTLEMPGGILDKNAHIELLSNKEAVVDGCHAIIEYCNDRIKLNIGHGSVCFTGRNLEITSLNENGLVIRGFLLSLEFCM